MIIKELKIGDIILVRENTPSSYLIRLLQTDCDYSHACIYVGNNLILTTGAKNFYWSGYKIANSYLKKEDKFAICRKNIVSSEDYMKIVNNSKKLLGKPYGTVKLLKLVSNIVKAKRILGDPAHYKGIYESHMFCSELVSNCVGYNFGKKAANVVTPENIYNDKKYETIYEGKLQW